MGQLVLKQQTYTSPGIKFGLCFCVPNTRVSLLSISCAALHLTNIYVDCRGRQIFLRQPWSTERVVFTYVSPEGDVFVCIMHVRRGLCLGYEDGKVKRRVVGIIYGNLQQQQQQQAVENVTDMQQQTGCPSNSLPWSTDCVSRGRQRE